MLTRRTLILAKVETTYGTDASPTAGSNAILVADAGVKVDGQVLERDFYRQSLSPLAHVIGRKVGEVTFTTEIKGAGAAYSATVKPETSPLFRGCGFSETIDVTGGSEKATYQPVSTAFESLTIYAYLDGILHKFLGCFGTFKLDVKAGEYGKIAWTFKGVYQAVTDVALPSGTFSAIVPPIAQSIGLGIGAYTTGVYTALSVDPGVAIAERLDVNSGSGGLKGLSITGRDTKGSVDPEAVTEATKPFWANWSAGTQEALTALIGSEQYNRYKIDAPKAQISEIGYGDRDGVRSYDLPLRFAQNTGDDEIVIAFT